jgi:tetratricopeptide (TPR) repeat protein
MAFYKWDADRTALKFLTEQAKFHLFQKSVQDFYSGLLRGFLRFAFRDLEEKSYNLVDFQVEFLAQVERQKSSGEFIQLPSEEEVQALIPSKTEIIATPPPESEKKEVPHDPTPLSEPQKPGTEEGTLEQIDPTLWIERDVVDPEELRYRQKGLQESQAGQREDCIQTCVEGLNNYPDSPYLLYLLGKTLRMNGEYHDALFLLEKVVTRYPEYSAAFLERDLIKKSLQDGEESDKDFTHTVDLGSKTARTE